MLALSLMLVVVVAVGVVLVDEGNPASFVARETLKSCN